MYSNAYLILNTIDSAQEISEAKFYALIKRFRADFLIDFDYTSKIERHRKPNEVTTALLYKLYDYIREIQQRPEMITQDNNTSSYVTTKVIDIWSSNKRFKKLYNALKEYCTQNRKDFNVVAVHIAECRAMYNLVALLTQRQKKMTLSVDSRISNQVNKIKITKTVHKLPFEVLGGDGFERIVFAYIAQTKEWDSIEWLGEVGDDGGRDIWGVHHGETYCYQCANYHPRLTMAKVMKDIKAVIKNNNLPDNLYIVCGGRVSNKLRAKIKQAIAEVGILNVQIWSGAEFEEKLRSEKPQIVKRFFDGQVFPELVDTKYASNNEVSIDVYRRLCHIQTTELLENFVDFPCEINSQESNTSFINVDNIFSNIVIAGESGCGKSLLANKLSLQTYDTNILSIILGAKYYETTLEDLLNIEIKSIGFNSIASFFEYCVINNIAPWIIIDGLNECDERKGHKLLIELLHMSDTQSMNWIVTTQSIPKELNESICTIIKVSKPNIETKKLIVAKYCSEQVLKRLEPIITAISTCLETRIIGQLGAAAEENSNRFTLLELFVRAKLGRSQSTGIQLMANMAKLMSKRISFSISSRDLDHILVSQSLDRSIFEDCVSRGFLSQNNVKISFSHEIFMNFFIADCIVRFSDGFDGIINALNQPKNYDKVTLSLGAITDIDICVKVLETIIDSDVLFAIAKGEAGSFPQAWVNYKVEQVLSLIKKEIAHLKFEIVDNEYSHVNITDSIITWSDQERALIVVLSLLLFKDRYVSDIFSIVEEAEDIIKAQRPIVKEILIEKGLTQNYSMFHIIYGGHVQTKLALTVIFNILSSGVPFSKIENEISDVTIRNLTRQGSIKTGQFYFLLLLCRYDETRTILYPYVKNALENKWRGLPSLLRTEILFRIGSLCTTEEQRLELIDIIKRLHSETSDAWESTNYFEALSTLGGLDEDGKEYKSTIEEQMRHALARPGDEDACREAAYIYNAQFDHPYDFAFSETIYELNENDKKVFFLMALKGTSTGLFSVSLIVQAIELAGIECCPHLSKWMEDPLHEKHMLQSGIASFMLCHILCGKLNYPVMFQKYEDELRNSFFACAEAYYWLNRTDLTLEERKLKCEPAVTILKSKSSRTSIECIRETEHSLAQNFYYANYKGSPILHLTHVFVEETAIIARNAIANRESQIRIFEFRGTEEITNYAIHLLGKYGNLTDIIQLRQLTTNSSFATNAVQAIKSLEQ